MFSMKTPAGGFILGFRRRFPGQTSISMPTVKEPPVQASIQRREQREARLAHAKLQVRRECVEILNKCALFDRFDMAADLIRSGEGPVAAHKRLLNARNRALRVSQRKNRISNHLATVSETRSGRLVENMKRRLAEIENFNGQ